MDKYGIMYVYTKFMDVLKNVYVLQTLKGFVDTINQRKGDQYEIYYYWEKH